MILNIQLQGETKCELVDAKHESHLLHLDGQLSYDPKPYGVDHACRFHIKTMQVDTLFTLTSSHCCCHSTFQGTDSWRASVQLSASQGSPLCVLPAAQYCLQSKLCISSCSLGFSNAADNLHHVDTNMQEIANPFA